MSSFRKRKNPIIKRGGFFDVRYVNRQVEDDSVISQVTRSDFALANPAPTLDEQLNAGVSLKEVPTNGILDSYDVNDTPLQSFEEKIVTKGKKKVEPKNEN